MVYSRTLRLKIENEKQWMQYLEAGGTVLLCAWHQQFFTALRYFKKYNVFNPSVMISQSRDGEIISGVVNRLGWKPVRGSSSKGGKAALKKMITDLKASRLSAHIVDGPRGPAGEIKAGVIRMAQTTDAAIVPFYVTADKAWYFNSWDRFMLPKPFSKVVLSFDKMIKFDRVIDKNDFEDKRKQLEKKMLPALK